MKEHATRTAGRRTLYPEIEPYRSGTLHVSPLHRVYWEECGNPKGKPAVFELDGFRPDPVSRARIRRELGLPDEALVVGLVARFHPDKDHRGFVAAAGQVAEAN